MNHATTPEHLQLDLTWQEPIPPAGVQAAMALMDSAKLHRYGETGAKPAEAAALEADFAAEIGMPYCVAMNSCGSTMFAALRCSGVRPGDKVLSNCFTLAPVPGAIAHAQAEVGGVVLPAIKHLGAGPRHVRGVQHIAARQQHRLRGQIGVMRDQQPTFAAVGVFVAL